MKNILLLGATGSIGDNVLSVIEQNKESLNLYGIALNSNISKANQIINKHSPMFVYICLLYTSPSPRDLSTSRMPSSA